MNAPTGLVAGLPAAILGVVLACFPARAQSGQPGDSDNAATYYRKAFEVLPDESDPNWPILQHPGAVKLDDAAVDFIRKHDTTFELLRKGAACKRCDWGAAPRLSRTAPRPHLTAARTISHVARLRSRLLLQQGRHAEAVDDVAALLVLSRHVGSEPFVAAKLAEASVADSAVDAAAPGMPAMPPEVARALMEKLERLPASLPPGEVVKRDGQQVAAEVQRSPVDAGAAGEVAARFEEAAKLLSLPFEQSFAPMQRWEAQLASASPAVRKWVPSLRTLRLAPAAAETRVQMLYVAAAIRLEGPRARFRFDEPLLKGPFEYREVPGGFELESKLVVDNVPVKLTCRPSGDQIPF